jgi:hypothetical protein
MSSLFPLWIALAGEVATVFLPPRWLGRLALFPLFSTRTFVLDDAAVTGAGGQSLSAESAWLWAELPGADRLAQARFAARLASRGRATIDFRVPGWPGAPSSAVRLRARRDGTRLRVSAGCWSFGFPLALLFIWFWCEFGVLLPALFGLFLGLFAGFATRRDYRMRRLAGDPVQLVVHLANPHGRSREVESANSR